jgi:hypothetical protein
MSEFSQANKHSGQDSPAQYDTPGADYATEALPGLSAQPTLSGVDPRKLKPAQVLQLQRTYGNQAVMRLLAQRKAAPPRPEPGPQKNQVERKIQEWPNPVLQNEGVGQPVEGKTEAQQAAQALSDQVDKAAEEINFVVFSYNNGLITPDEALGYLEGFVLTYHVDNFINKLIDWKATGKKVALLKSAAGYVIEGFADDVAKKLSHTTQFASGGARPDYQVKTNKTYDFKGSSLAADALIDSTSEAEALKGHISEKVTRMDPEDAVTHPHLFDVYYEDLGIGEPTKTPAKNSDLTKRRSEYHAKKIAITKSRRESLRPRTGGKVKRDKPKRFSPY